MSWRGERRRCWLASPQAGECDLYTRPGSEALFPFGSRLLGLGGPHFNFQPYDYGPLDRDESQG